MKTPGSTTKPRAPTILVIDDDEKQRTWLSSMLSQSGYRIETAASGAGALAICRNKSVDAITLDLILRDMGGWELFHAIRNDQRNCDKPVIILSVVTEKEVARAFPVWDYLVKPVRPEDLLASLQRAGIKAEKDKRISLSTTIGKPSNWLRPHSSNWTMKHFVWPTRRAASRRLLTNNLPPSFLIS